MDKLDGIARTKERGCISSTGTRSRFVPSRNCPSGRGRDPSTRAPVERDGYQDAHHARQSQTKRCCRQTMQREDQHNIAQHGIPAEGHSQARADHRLHQQACRCLQVEPERPAHRSPLGRQPNRSAIPRGPHVLLVLWRTNNAKHRHRHRPLVSGVRHRA